MSLLFVLKTRLIYHFVEPAPRMIGKKKMLRVRKLCRELITVPGADASKLILHISESLEAVRTVIESNTNAIINGMNRQLWESERLVLFFLLSDRTLKKAMHSVPTIMLVSLKFLELHYGRFQAHVALIRAVVQSGQNAAYLIALELPILRKSDFSDTFVLSGTFPLPANWNWKGASLDFTALETQIKQLGGTCIECEFQLPPEPMSVISDADLALCEDVDVVQALLSAEHCAWCNATRKLRKCGTCMQVRYCSKEHQTNHWAVHARQCPKLKAWGKLRLTPIVA